MSEYVSGRAENNYINIKKYLELMKANCNELDDAALTDGFDGFVADLISGYLEKTGIEEDIASAIMQSFMDELCLNTENGEHTDFWKAYICAAQKADREECISVFAGNTAAFMQLIEKQTIFLFDFPDIKGTAERYMSETFQHMQTLSADSVFRDDNIETETDTDCVISQIKDKTVALHDDALLDEKYLAAVNKASSDNISDLQECIDDFDELGDWKDSRELKEKCENKAIQILSERDVETENKQITVSQRKKRKWLSFIVCIAVAAIIAVFIVYILTEVPEIPNGEMSFTYSSHYVYICEDELVFGYWSGFYTYDRQYDFKVTGTICSNKELINILNMRSVKFEDGRRGWVSYNEKTGDLKIHYKNRTYLYELYGFYARG